MPNDKRYFKNMQKSFAQKVRAVVQQIPRGQTLSYAEVARRAGSPRAARAVGNLLAQNFDPTVPCHRVVHTDGRIGRYNRGQKSKIQKLRAEGVRILRGKIL